MCCATCTLPIPGYPQLFVKANTNVFIRFFKSLPVSSVSSVSPWFNPPRAYATTCSLWSLNRSPAKHKHRVLDIRFEFHRVVDVVAEVVDGGDFQ